MSPSEGSRGQAAAILIPQTEAGQAEPSAKPRLDADSARRRLLLEGPIFSTIVRLAAPNIVGSFAQISATVILMYFFGLLGTDAMAGVTLVFPCLNLMQMVATGVGAGVSSGVARSLGAGRRADAEALVLNALFLAVCFGILFTAVEFFLGASIYRLLGGTGAALADSLTYSHWVFGASVLVWAMLLLFNALIGSGNTVVPQIASLLFLAMVPLTPALMFGWGPLPRLGIAGGGLAIACYYIVVTAGLFAYFRSSRTTLRLPLDLRLIERRFLREILKVGGPAALSAVIPAVSLILITAVVARFGTDAVAGFGIAMRMEFVLLPLYFGVCAGIVAMVGTNVGAGQVRRARLVAWAGALIAAGIGGVAGLILVVAPLAWVGLFTSEPAVIAVGSLYFGYLALQYPFTAAGIVLGAAAQSAGRPLWPLAAVITRVTIAAGGGWFVVAVMGGHLKTLFLILTVAGVFYCGVLVAGQMLGRIIPDRS